MSKDKNSVPLDDSITVPNAPILLSYQLKSHQIRLKDNVSITFMMDVNDLSLISPSFVYKIYYCISKQPKVLISSGFSKPKKNLKLKAKFSLINQKPSFIFYFRCEILVDNKLIAENDTENCTLVDYKLQDHFKVRSLECVSPLYIPNNPIVFWFIYTVDLLPEIIELKIIAKLIQDKNIIDEKQFPFQIGKKKAHPYKKYPLKFVSNKIPNENDELALSIEVIEPEKSSTIYTNRINLMPLIQANGVYVSHVGYKRDIALGEVAYLIAEIENKIDSKTSGRIELFYYTEETDLLPIVKRKFHIDPDNRDVISEDETLPDIIGGREYWVVGRYSLSVKKNGLTIAGEALSTKSLARIKNTPVFNIKINYGINSNFVYFNDIIPIGIDIRIESNNTIKNTYCEIIEELQGLSSRVLYAFKIKDQYVNDTFRWKVPPTCATATLTARINYGKVSVDLQNMKIMTNVVEILPPNSKKSQND